MSNQIQSIGHSSISGQFKSGNMTDKQKTSFQEIIAKYDSTNLTKADFESMGKEFRQAGISPSREVKSLLETSGFDVDKFIKEPSRGEHGPSRGMGGLQKPKNAQEGLNQLLSFSEEIGDTDLQNMIKEIQEKEKEGTMTEEDDQKLTNYLQQKAPLIGFFVDSSI